MSGVVGACSGIMDVFHAQRVCPVENPCVWPNCVPPRRRTCAYDAVFVGRNMARINVLSSPCLCTANSGQETRRLEPQRPIGPQQPGKWSVQPVEILPNSPNSIDRLVWDRK